MEPAEVCTRVRRVIEEAVNDRLCTIYADARKNDRRFKPYLRMTRDRANKAMVHAVETIRNLDLTPVDFGLVSMSHPTTKARDQRYTFFVAVREAL